MRWAFLSLILLAGCEGGPPDTATIEQARTAPAPLFRDPTYNGPCDPQIVWNHYTQEWWIFYTGRRSTLEGGATWYACAIGVAASKDGREWRHLGYCKFDGVGGTADMPNTYWAPGIIRDGDTYHMFVTKLPGHPEPFTGTANIVHYTATVDLLNDWTQVGPVGDPGQRIIDAGLLQVGDTWRLWHKRPPGGRTGMMSSPDLRTWTVHGLIGGDVNERPGHEAPYPFRWHGSYWLVTDPHRGLDIFQSDDAETWTLNNTILLEDGSRPADYSRGRHPSVVVTSENRAFIFYHVEPDRYYDRRIPAPQKEVSRKWSVLQVAELEYIDGNIVCDRDKPFDLFLPPGD